MTLMQVGVGVAWLTVAAGLGLASGHVRRRRMPRWLLWAHPLLATAALALLWSAAVRASGPPDMAFNSGAFVITLGYVGGGLLFALRRMGATRLPILVIGFHAVIVLVGCVLVSVGALR